MLRICSAVLFLSVLVSACDPFSAQSSNQFRLKNQGLFFQEQLLATWLDDQIPYCEQCIFTIHKQKMLPSSMLFKQVNNQRGALIFLAASNVRHTFALITGSAAYAIRVKKQDGRYLLTSDQQHSAVITEKTKTALTLDGESYFVYLQENDQDAAALDLIFWLSNHTKSIN